MKIKLFLSILVMIFFASSCTKEFQPDVSFYPDKGGHNGQYSGIKIAVVSDIHYLDPSLLKNNAAAGTAFQDYLAADPKLLEYSDPIFRSVMAQLKFEKPDILLIPGDLTKDGEKVSHQSMALLLKQLKDVHIQVYVVPGNHDINNPEARRYNGNNAFPTPIISAAEFSSIYSAFGYGNAISRDPSSLSYVCQPYPNLWIMGIDDCEYYNNTNIAIVAGKIKPETMQWALGMMEKARRQHITVLGLMHHGMVEHYMGQNQLDPGYVTDNYEAVSDQFMNAGLTVWFTGHYHANDITQRTSGGKNLIDIETGSLVSTPSPFRIVTLNDKSLNISTKHVTSINASFPGGLNFLTYSNMFISGHLDGYFGYMLSNPPYSLDPSTVAYAAPLFRNAFMAHLAGDEKISAEEQANDDALGPELGVPLTALWTDLPTADNNLYIKIPTH